MDNVTSDSLIRVETVKHDESLGDSHEVLPHIRAEYPVLEKRIWRKLDFYILPVVAMFYLLSFLVCIISLVKA